MNDALRLAAIIGRIAEVSGDEEKVKELMGTYQEEMLDRGVKAVRASRGAFASNNEGRVTWGQPVRELAIKKVSLLDIPLLL